MARTNSQIVPAALRGKEAANGRGSFWTPGDNVASNVRLARGWASHYRAMDSLNAVAAETGGVQGIIMSYDTPIAAKVAGVWFRLDVSYSPTTQIRHATHLWHLAPEWLPTDASVEDVRDVLAGFIEYDRRAGKFKRGVNARFRHVIRLNGRVVLSRPHGDSYGAHRAADKLAAVYPDRRVTVTMEEQAA